MIKNHSLGLFGFGCVGQGLYHTLKHSIHRNIQIDKVCIRNADKARNLNRSYFTIDRNVILKNINHDFIVELTDDADSALEIVRSALTKGKNAVSANKKMIAENLEELLRIQFENDASFLYDASCAGSIPVIRILEDYYQNEKIISVRGILNGTSNYILSNMNINKLSFDEALKNAQELGFAETDPTSDISGLDTKYKNCIICLHSNGIFLKPENVINLGIKSIKKTDIDFAEKIDSRIKLVSYIYEKNDVFTTFVIPTFIQNNDNLYNVDQENNGLEIEGEFSSKQVYTGKGAGSFPTGMAVLSDIASLVNGYKYNYLKVKKNINENCEYKSPDYNFDLKVYIGFKNEKDIAELNIHTISEKDLISENKFLVGYTNIKSIKKLPQKVLDKIFICAFEPLKYL